MVETLTKGAPVSYQTQSALETDQAFVARSRAALTEQGLFLGTGQPADVMATAGAVLRSEAAIIGTFARMLPGTPGWAAKVDTGEGIDSSLITDADLLSGVQAAFPTVAALYYAPDGSPKP